jgi:LacI family transcriptional regulator
VAQLAGVDVSVVSKVLNGDARLTIRPETRQRVLGAIATSGYRPNAVARSLRRSRNDMYGLVVPDFANPIYAQIIQGAEQSADAVGKLIFASSAIKRDLDKLEVILGAGRLDGLLLAMSLSLDADRQLGAKMPWLYLNRRGPEGRRYVCLDDEQAAKLAVSHLLELGHEQIGHISGPMTADTATRRRAGFRAALRSAGLKDRGSLTVGADYTPQGGAAAAQRIMTGRSIPTGLFVANVASAIGVMWWLQSAGFQVPRDVSVVSIHDLPLADYLLPPLTTVRMPLAELGKRGVELLSTTKASASITEVVSEPMELIVRGSTGPVR